MTDSYTSWQRSQHDEDGGLAARLAVAHDRAAAELRNLSEALMPVAPNQYFYAVAGTAEERHAAVDAWAARHHVTAGWVLGIGYCARVPGEITLLVIALPVVTGYGEDVPAASDPELAVAS